MKRVDTQVIQEMTARLAAEFDPEAIILFGSHAWGSPGEESDIDLLVVVSESDVSPARRAIRARRCLRGITVAKDVLVKTSREFEKFAGVRASLEHKIREGGKVLYGRRQG